MRELIYSRRQIGTTFNFYVDDKVLTAETVYDGETREAVLIKGLPELGDFRDETVKKRSREILENSYFVGMGCEVHVNARLRGGWGDEIHKGYQVFAGRTQYAEESTYGWARAIGEGFTSLQAQVIADACQYIDDYSATKPTNLSDQSWHFDSTNTWETWATRHDVRIQHVYAQLNAALQLPKNSENSLTSLGYGLHALQDTFAHTPDFNICAAGICMHGNTADDPQTLPKRYLYTKQATIAYLQSYLDSSSLKLDTFLRYAVDHPPRRDVGLLQKAGEVLGSMVESVRNCSIQ